MTDPVSKLLPYGLGGLAFLAVALFLAKAYLGELFKVLGGSTPGVLQRSRLLRRRLGGRRLRRYRRRVADWYGRHLLGEGEDAIDVRRILVPVQHETADGRAPVHEELRRRPRLVVLGEPGAGKSLLLKSEVLHWADSEDDTRVPVLVDLHRCNVTEQGFRDMIVETFDKAKVRNAGSLVDRALDDGRLWVLFDGLDEVALDAQERVVKDLLAFAQTHERCPMVVTCRSTAYRGQLGEQFDRTLRVANFDDAAIRTFLGNWRGFEGPADVERLYRALSGNRELLLLARSPLMLTLICYLQSGARGEARGPLPNSRVAFYEDSVNHLLDRDNRLGRSRGTTVYPANKKIIILQQSALAMMETPSNRGGRLDIAQHRLRTTVRGLLPGVDLEEQHGTPLLDEIVRRSQLLVPVDRAESGYRFAHLTLQEFLAARSLRDDPDRLLRNYRQDRDGWRETLKMWCAVANVDCTRVVREVFTSDDPRERVLALECLADAAHIEPELAGRIIDSYITQLRLNSWGEGADPADVAAGLSTLAAASTPRGRQVREQLAVLARNPGEPCRPAALQALAASGHPDAARILAELAGAENDDLAGEALAGMGDISVPALAEGAQREMPRAVELLATVGTPAAAEALVGLLWLPDGRRVEAAWALAVLLAKPEVEERLRALDGTDLPEEAFPYATRYSWVWEPFAATPAMEMITARVAEVLHDTGDDELPGPLRTADGQPATVDPRIGIPVVADGIRSRLRISAGDRERLLTEARAVIQTPGQVTALLRGDLRSALELLSEQPLSERLLRLRDDLLETSAALQRYRHLTRLLPWPVQANLLGRLLSPGAAADTAQEWRQVGDNPSEPVGLRRIVYGLGTALVVALVAAGGVTALNTIAVDRDLPGRAWGPSWLVMTAVGCFVAGAALVVWGAVEDVVLGDLLSGVVIVVGLLGMTFGVGYAVVLALAVPAHWLGWAWAGSAGAAAVLLFTLLTLALRRRTRAVENPLRYCLLVARRA